MRATELFQQLHRDERGSFSLSHIILILFFSIVTVALMNTGTSLSDRSREQRQADAVAEGLANWKARNLNAVVAQQHLIGELLSFVVVHDAIGGSNLDTQTEADTRKVDSRLDWVAAEAQALGANTYAYDDVSQSVKVEAALLKSYVRLKRILTGVYYGKIAAKLMQRFPPTYAAGVALEKLCDAIDRWIQYEWSALKSLERKAIELSARKKEIRDQILPRAKHQLVRLVKSYPDGQKVILRELENRLEGKVHILPSDCRLPLKPDPLARLAQPPSGWQPPPGDFPVGDERATNLREQLVKVTQLSRATFPWVNFHRERLVARMKRFAPLSLMGTYYYDMCNGKSKQIFDDLQDPSLPLEATSGKVSLALYVLDDYQGPDKAYEKWMEASGSSAADKTFGLTILFGRPTRKPVGSSFFHPSPTSYTYRYATALVWNRRSPEKPAKRINLYRKRIVPVFQAETGWDTLNWSGNKPVSELVGKGTLVPHRFPQIAPTWSATLTPTSPARFHELRTQALPDWGQEFRSITPPSLPEELVGL